MTAGFPVLSLSFHRLTGLTAGTRETSSLHLHHHGHGSERETECMTDKKEETKRERECVWKKINPSIHP